MYKIANNSNVNQALAGVFIFIDKQLKRPVNAWRILYTLTI